MADFTLDLQTLRSSFSYMENDVSMYQFGDNDSFPNVTSSFSNDNFFSHGQAQGQELGNFASNFNFTGQESVPVSQQHIVTPKDEDKKGKGMALSETSSGISSSHLVSDNNNNNKRKNSSGKGKRPKKDETEEEKSREVVHVRARRGQATDSHSLAERVRRGKINERLKSLQNIVPGCYKTMGMATMLDEIINYVQSLQNQVEFLSMKLTAASTFYDFNSDTDIIQTSTTQGAKAYENNDLEGQIKAEYSFNPSWPL